jgi:hypothetical protein
MLIAALTAATPASATVAGLPAWDVVRSPNPDASSEFNGVQRVAPSQVWAVGAIGNRSLTARWNGSAFVAVPSPNVSDKARVLEDVDGTARDDVWAVGHSDRLNAFGSVTLIIHWNGSSWSKVASPNLGDTDDANVLSGVAAISADDAWAVGYLSGTGPGSVNRSLTLHWDGKGWESVDNQCGPFLREVVALASNNVWAVGGNSTCQWNGFTWTRRQAAPHPNPNVFIDLQDVTATGPNNVWAVGYGSTSCGEGVCFTGVIERWNGSGWLFTGVGETLSGVDARGPSDIYAVGLGQGPAVLHYDGTAWERVPVPNPIPPGRLLAVDAVPSGPIWAVGWQLKNGGTRTLAERAPSPNSGAVVGSTAVGNATVSWFGPEEGSVESDQAGRYSVGGLRAGTYNFVATFPGCSPRSRSVEIVAGTTKSVSLQIAC